LGKLTEDPAAAAKIIEDAKISNASQDDGKKKPE
jgi:hypothetical protein